ncbi:FAD-binding and (Fe-S)-binding domain-containing protein [Streptomyces sp. NPDC014995]|uniref:FAD-binding and (Fe-S)-binding domain-containing protein n=1 Tax=Streptomyces sp. NPDC014995 TaxID=3364936 RepID=UPI003701C392
MTDTTTALEPLVARLAETAPGLRVETGPGSTGLYAYDASNYRVPPRAVVFPRSADDVVAVLRACREAHVPVTARGGGTSMAGNAVGPGVVLDFSRYMNRILDINPTARTARVEAGVVPDALRGATALHGLTFGPDPSSHSRRTLGGMIGNDACGNRSVRHGRTSSHIEALEIVTADGVRAVADRTGLRAADPNDTDAVERVARLEADVRRPIEADLAPIRTELGRVPRQVSGYQLHHLLPEHGFDMARALVGTEGSCAVVTAATVRLVATAQASTLLTLGYDDVVDAAEDVPEILRRHPTAVEGMDEAIVATMRARRGPDSVTGLPEGRAWLYVELDGDDQAVVDARADELLEVLKARGRMTGGRVVHSPAERRSLWRVREDGAGLAARLVDGGESWPGWEDAAVAPENLAAYLRDFRKLLATHGLTGVLYGHFGAGCVHVRIDFDLATDPGRAAARRFLTEAAALVVEHGGTLSGEHGDVDSFTRAFRPEVAGAASRVLADAGIPCTAQDGLCCGLTWVSTGQLSLARRIMARTVAHLDNGDDRPIVVAEPSCAAALKRDVPELLGTDAARRVAARVHTLTGALTDLATPGWAPPELPDNVVLQTHCHEYATFKGRHPRDLLGRLGVHKIDEAEGCCGLAGNFGFEEQHYDTSMAVADLALRPRLDDVDPHTPAVVVADGFSCATQIDHLAGDRGIRALHLAELLDPAADRPGQPGENS